MRNRELRSIKKKINEIMIHFKKDNLYYTIYKINILDRKLRI